MTPSRKAKEKTDVRSPGRNNLLLVNKNQFTLEHFCIKNINTLTFTSCSFAKKVDQRGLSFSHFFIQTPNIQVSQDHVWIEQVSLDTRSGNFYLFPLVALRYRHVRKSNFDAELKMLFLRAIFCIPVRMKFQTTFLGRYITTNFISAHVACTTLLLASIHEKSENDVLHV